VTADTMWISSGLNGASSPDLTLGHDRSQPPGPVREIRQFGPAKITAGRLHQSP
jgi:hypothetical protein